MSKNQKIRVKERKKKKKKQKKWEPLLLHTTCVRSCCTWRASCVAAFNQKKNIYAGMSHEKYM